MENQLQPHQQRVVAEKTELDEKLSKLNAFMDGEQFRIICDSDECDRLVKQRHAMERYSNILGERISAFS